MRTTAATLMLVLMLASGVAPASAGRAHFGSMTCSDLEEPLRWGERHDLRHARFAMPAGDGEVTLVLTRRVVALQLSDRILRELDRELDREEDESAGWLEHVIKGAVIGGVRNLLDHSLECRVAELRDVRYRDGRLVLVTEDGDRIFEDVKYDDRPILESFADEDARAFVREFRRLKGGASR
jgi:hypothetical protein